MQWIILIGDKGFNLNLIRNLQHNGEISSTSLTENRFVVDYGNDHVFYDSAEDIINDYEEDEKAQIPFPNPQFIIMTYTNGELMRRILSQENFPPGIYIDDDNGKILPLDEFIIS